MSFGYRPDGLPDTFSFHRGGHRVFDYRRSPFRRAFPHGRQVERIAFRPTFRCLVCGYVWDGSKAKLVFLTRPPDPDDEEGIDAVADLLMRNGCFPRSGLGREPF